MKKVERILKENNRIRKTYELSTGNISKADADALSKLCEADSPLLVAEYEYGFFVSVLSGIHYSALSESFQKVMRKAQSLGCSYVIFDRDGDVDETLDIHEW